jgi:hypothetical protein
LTSTGVQEGASHTADVYGQVVVPNTGQWQASRTIRKDGIVLEAGHRRIRLVFMAAGTNGIANVNFLRSCRNPGARLRSGLGGSSADAMVWTRYSPRRRAAAALISVALCAGT